MSRFHSHMYPRDMPSQCGHRRLMRAGHTLIEILLALGLSLVILAAAYAALDQHWRYAETGQRQTERMQVTRALFERMSLDVRSVVFHQATPAGDSRHSPAGAPPATIGIVGDGETLFLRVDAHSADSPAGLQTIRWEMHAITDSASGQTTLALARIVRRATSWDAEKTVSPKDLLAAEVEAIRFRYFARGSWIDRWDSVERQELPRAVEISIDFRKANAVGQTTGDRTSPGEYRLIVPVPASEA